MWRPGALGIFTLPVAPIINHGPLCPLHMILVFFLAEQAWRAASQVPLTLSPVTSRRLDYNIIYSLEYRCD